MDRPAGFRVLIADDNRDTVVTLGILLRSEGYVVQLVDHSGDALAAAESFQPQVVLLDIGTPDRSGLQVALDLRRRYGDKCPVLVAVGAHGKPHERTEARGFDHFVAKPYEPEGLLKLLASLRG